MKRQKKYGRMMVICALAAALIMIMAMPIAAQATEKTPADPSQQTPPAEQTEPVKYRGVYRVEVNNGVMRCYRYNLAGQKASECQKDRYFIVKFDKGSKTEGKAIKKVGKSGTLYYFSKSGKGKKYTGWYKRFWKKYYFKKGIRLKGTKKVKRTWYVFSKKDGQRTFRIGDNIDKRAQGYSSRTKNLIVLKVSEHKVRIYKGKKNKWKRIRTYRCTTGAPSTPTIRGNFTVGIKGAYFNTGTNQRCWYYTQFCGNYLFHSVIYDRSSSPVHVVDGRLGINASHGCVRLALNHAKWIYKHIRSGTKVVIY